MDDAIPQPCCANLAPSWPALRILTAKLSISLLPGDNAEQNLFTLFIYIFQGRGKKVGKLFCDAPARVLNGSLGIRGAVRLQDPLWKQWGVSHTTAPREHLDSLPPLQSPLRTPPSVCNCRAQQKSPRAVNSHFHWKRVALKCKLRGPVRVDPKSPPHVSPWHEQLPFRAQALKNPFAVRRLDGVRSAPRVATARHR